LKVKVRILASTNQDLHKNVVDGTFREDLYYRLNVFPIEIPPLRERREDIAVLAEAFLKLYGRKHGVPIEGFSDSAIDALVSHDWPGNIRELQNVVERAVILSEPHRPIDVNLLGMPGNKLALHAIFDVHTTPRISDCHDGDIKSLREVEKEHIFRALRHTNNNRAEASALLKITARTLSNKLKEYVRRSPVADLAVTTGWNTVPRGNAPRRKPKKWQSKHEETYVEIDSGSL
jgi:transcriptional regulator with PAS, ATPase and Fis domain